MPLPNIELFCPNCKECGDLWESPRLHFETTCKTCGQKWEKIELKEICYRIIKKAEADRSSQHYAGCLRILMQHTINPFTGRTYA